MRCATISTAYTTTHVWQPDTRSEGEEMRAGLPSGAPAPGAEPGPRITGPEAPARKGLLWLVAEEVQTGPPPVPPERAARGARAGATGARPQG